MDIGSGSVLLFLPSVFDLDTAYQILKVNIKKGNDNFKNDKFIKLTFPKINWFTGIRPPYISYKFPISDVRVIVFYYITIKIFKKSTIFLNIISYITTKR